MKKNITILLLVMLVFPPLVSCGSKGQRLDEIRSMIVEDKFVYSDRDTFRSGTSNITYNDSGIIEFYDDGTYYKGIIRQKRTYDDNGEIIYYEYGVNKTYQETIKYYGTFEVKYDEDDDKKIVVALNATTRSYEKYDGSEITVTKNDENFNDTSEYTVYLKNNLIERISMYNSLNYAAQAVVDAATSR